MSAQAANFSRRPVLQALVSLMLALLALLASGAVRADPPGRVGRIADTQGTVWLFDDEQGEWIQAGRNRPVTAGDRVSAERGARATIQIGSGTVRLAGDTEVEFVDLDDRHVRMRLHNGSLALRLRSNESARDFDVITPEGQFDPVAAGRYRVDRKDEGSFGAVISGQMHFEARDSALDLTAGQRAEFWSERGATHYAWAAAADDRFAEWVAREEREDDLDYAREQRRHYVSPEMTGAEDLDRNGQWDRHPEYGPIWYPTVVVADWAPYRYGHWAFVRPWGWTWVDDAPWGFAPFHYGRWVNYGGRWGWAPGTYVARPVYAPALVGWIGGSNVSIGISIGGGPSVGWVPLAPRDIYRPTYQVTNIYVQNVNSPYQRWHGPNPRYERTVPTGPIMYSNQGVAGGVTVVPSNVLRERQPITKAVIKPVDVRTIAEWQQRTPPQQAVAAPPAPTPRVVATPGGAVPAAPGAARATPWTPPAAERFGGGRPAARGNDGGEQQRGRAPAAAPAPAARVEPSPARAQDRAPDRVPERGDRTIGTVPPRPNQAAPGREGSQDRRERDAAPMPAQPGVVAAPPVARPVSPSAQAAPGVRPVQPVQPAQSVQPVQPVQPLHRQPGQATPPAAKEAPQQGVREPRGRGQGERDAERDDRSPPGQDRRRGEPREQQNR